MKLLYTHLKLFLQCAVFIFGCTFLLHIESKAQAPANDNCAAGSPTLTVSPTCAITTSGTLYNATFAAGAPAFPSANCGVTGTAYDVWYRFTATATSHTITFSAFGNLLDPTTTYVQLYTGACGGMANFNSCHAMSDPYFATNFAVGTQYYVRVYTNVNPNTGGLASRWAFTMCLQASPPQNDICANATLLTTAGTTCTATNGNVNNATVTGGDPGASLPCAGTVGYDVWYKFVATSSNPTITVTSTGANFPSAANLRIQLFSGYCGSLTPVGCLLGYVFTPTGLTQGVTYYVRLWSTGAAPTTLGSFTICVQDNAVPDLCANAILITSSTSCTNTAGTITGSTFTAGTGIPGCGTNLRPDVWYKFYAQSTSPSIYLSGALVNPAMTLFTGNCAAFTASSCGTTSIFAANLVIGQLYYIRVYSTSATTGTFNLCVVDPSRVIGAGNSYVNVTKKAVGGVVQKDDTLEIRSSYYFNSNYDAGNNMTNVRFYDSLPTKTAILTPLVMPAGDTLLRVITNEGVTLTTNKFTATAADDAGTYIANPGVAGRYQIRINIGATAAPWVAAATGNATTSSQLTNATGAGSINPNSTLPLANSGTLITASYFVKVTGNPNDTIRLAASKLIYTKGSNATDTTITLTPYLIYISPTGGGLCLNATGINVASENAGTFGTGNTKERATTLQVPINSYGWRAQVSSSFSLGDGFYSIVNNLSPTGGTNNNANYTPVCGNPPPTYECANRMHGGFWDIIGDHTGTNNAIGNPAATPGQIGGYMLAVNADMIMSDAFKQRLDSLCPGTYYQYSAWVKNVCKGCGINESGQGTYRPGVLPNLTFSVNGLDYYSTGSVDTVGWVKKGFIFQTGDTQTVANIAIRNNAPGGGGNDWVLDDIEISTCLPNMSYAPGISPPTCENNALLITDTIRSIYDNYKFYKWQISTDGGANWSDISGTSGTGTPVIVNGMYQYVAAYTIPPAFTTMAHNGDRYRVVVATTSPNLANTKCLSSDALVISLAVLDCGTPLSVNFLSFSGKLVNKKASLTWTTTKEDGPITFSVEKSVDGVNFTSIAIVPNYKNYNSEINTYNFVDPTEITCKTYYKIIMTTQNGKKRYTNTIQMNVDPLAFAFGSVVNPFKSQLDFEVICDERTRIDVMVYDMYGKPVKQANYLIGAGTNSLRMENMDNLSSGTYVLQVVNKGVTLNRKVVKK